jgi:hemerythrin-like domain-containing protein
MTMLSTGRKGDEQFKAELQVLGESVKHHVEEEESQVFGIARQIMDKAELEAVGEAWERAKHRAGAANGVVSKGRKASAKRSKRKASR